MSRQNHMSLGHFARDLHSPMFRDELRTGWSIALLYRVPGVGLAWACARAGISPLAVSLMALVGALAMPPLAVGLPITVAPLCLMLAGVLFQVLDCTDGTLARGTGRASQRGADLDFLIDMAQWGLLYVSLGLLADRLLGGGFGWAFLGAVAAWARLLARVIRDRLMDETEVGVEPAPLTLRDAPAIFLGGISGLIPFIALSGTWIGFWMIALTVYSLLDIAEGLLPLARRA